MKMNGITSELSGWLSKYTRESWKYDPDTETISVTGNITITDSQMEKLPVNFSSVTGKIKFRNCSKLKSLDGFPESYEEISFENCLFPSEIYIESIRESYTLEEYLHKNISSLDEETLSLVETHFPKIYESHRGQMLGTKFGF